jgi:hypothetical protein
MNHEIYLKFQFQFKFILLSFDPYDLPDMERINTEDMVTNIVHDVRYNTINFRIHLNR